jgi:GTP-binding protein
MLPVIAIVGRPNVGKSTLFNTLTQTRDALVVDLPGTTRDRQYGEGKMGERPYIVIDTGGVDADEKINLQSWHAVAEADVVLFIVDAQVGITHADLDYAKKLRKSTKPVHLVLNKTDGVDINTTIADYYSLGFGEPLPISASKKRGLAQLTATVLADFAAQPVAEEEVEAVDPGIKVAVVGQPNGGKSTLINRMLGEDRVIVSDQAGTTRDSIHIPFEREGQQFTLIDTAGVRRKARIKETIEKFSVVKALQSIESCNVVVFVIDAQKGITDQDLSLLGFVIESGRALIIAINKWDALDPNEKDAVKRTLNYKIPFADFAIIHYISALHGSGVGNLFTSIIKAY